MSVCVGALPGKSALNVLPCSRFQDQRGTMTVEACITVMVFMILMFFLSTLFTMFMAQNTTAHVALQASQSLSVDALAGEEIGDGVSDGVSVKGIAVSVYHTLFGNPNDSGAFATDSNVLENAISGEELAKVVKKRFVGYLAGGDEEKATEILKAMGVEDGVDGLDFSESSVEDGYLRIVLTYRFKNDFKLWNVKAFEVRQTTCSKLWS